MNNKNEPLRQAIIIGGGIGGTTAALVLQQHGIPTRILERRPAPQDEAPREGGTPFDTTPPEAAAQNPPAPTEGMFPHPSYFATREGDASLTPDVATSPGQKGWVGGQKHGGAWGGLPPKSKAFAKSGEPAGGARAAGLQLAPNATRILHTLGLADELAAISLAPRAIEIRDGMRPPRAQNAAALTLPLGADLARRYGAPYLLCRRGDLLALLRAHLAAPTEHAREVTRLAEHPDRITAHCADGTAAEAPHLIAADGVHSRIRAHLFPDEHAAPQPIWTIWRLQLEGESHPLQTIAESDTIQLWGGISSHMVAYPLPETARHPRAVNLVAVAQTLHPDADPTAAFAHWKALPWLAALRAHPWKRYPIETRAPLPACRHERITLIGDAAHPLPPFLAQGAGMAIEDAAALAHGPAALDAPARRDRIERLRRAVLAQADWLHRRGLRHRLAWHPLSLRLADAFARPLRDARLSWLYAAS